MHGRSQRQGALRARSHSAEQALQRLGVTPPNDDILRDAVSGDGDCSHGRGLFSANRALLPEGLRCEICGNGARPCESIGAIAMSQRWPLWNQWA